MFPLKLTEFRINEPRYLTIKTAYYTSTSNMEAALPQYNATKLESQTAILDWIRTTEEFYRSYMEVSQTLKDHRKTRYSRSATASSRHIRNLQQLHLHMNEVLKMLLTDINKSMPNAGSTNSTATLSKTGQLMTHTQLLKEINWKISSELTQLRTLQA